MAKRIEGHTAYCCRFVKSFLRTLFRNSRGRTARIERSTISVRGATWCCCFRRNSRTPSGATMRATALLAHRGLLHTDQAGPQPRQFPRIQRKREPMANPDCAAGPYPATLSGPAQSMAPQLQQSLHPPARPAPGRPRYSASAEKLWDSRRHAQSVAGVNGGVFAGIYIDLHPSPRTAMGQHMGARGKAWT